MADSRRPPIHHRLVRGALIAGTLIAAAIAWNVGRRSDRTQAVELHTLVKPGAARGHNVLLVTLDTTRPDHLGCYGYGQAVTPAIDSLVQHGVRFDDAVASVPLTLPSHSTILTGLAPYRHGVRTNGGYRLAEEHLTLAEHVQQAGYATAAFVSCFVLDQRFGLAQGFDTYEFAISRRGARGVNSVCNERYADDVTNAAIDWLKGREASEQPYFAWVHYFDPHHPYESPLTGDPRFRGRGYDAEIAFMDQEVGRLLEALDSTGARSRTLVILASDHGESLNEHGEEHHGVFVYEATVHAALIMSCPTLWTNAYRVDDRLVGLVDIFPTIVDLLGLPAVQDLDGISLLAAPPDGERAIYVESTYPLEGWGCSPVYGLRTLTHKFIQAPRPEFYVLRDDPHELNNLFEPPTPVREDLAVQLAAIRSSSPMADPSSAGAYTPLTPDERARLESLGYVGGAKVQTAEGLPDAKDLLPVIQEIDRAVALGKVGKLDEALAIAQAVATEAPDYDTAVHTIAHLYEAMGRRLDAVKTLEAYVVDHPSSNLYLQLATNLLELGRLDEFDRALQAAEVIEPGRGTIFILRGDRYFADRRYADAVREYEKALEVDRQRVEQTIGSKLESARKWAQQPAP